VVANSYRLNIFYPNQQPDINNIWVCNFNCGK